MVAASSSEKSVPTWAASTEARASRKSPDSTAMVSSHCVLTLATLRRVAALSMTSSWCSEPRCTSSTDTPPMMAVSGTGSPATPRARQGQAGTDALAAGGDEVASDFSDESQVAVYFLQQARLHSGQIGRDVGQGLGDIQIHLC